jgi:hypothetical protein
MPTGVFAREASQPQCSIDDVVHLGRIRRSLASLGNQVLCSRTRLDASSKNCAAPVAWQNHMYSGAGIACLPGGQAGGLGLQRQAKNGEMPNGEENK